jgi:hypothetical protein
MKFSNRALSLKSHHIVLNANSQQSIPIESENRTMKDPESENKSVNNIRIESENRTINNIRLESDNKTMRNMLADTEHKNMKNIPV